MKETEKVKPARRKGRGMTLTRYVLVNVCRFILAVTFLFSALTKANDPVGLMIKLKDYASALGMTDLPEYILYSMGYGLVMTETLLGIYLFLGMRHRRRVAAFAALFMMVMTVLTVWIAVANPVSDCGCFGDAVVLTNVQTLIKNVVLLAMAVVVYWRYKLMFRLIHKYWNWVITAPVALMVTVLFSYTAYMLPIVDFLPFAEGTDLRETVRVGDALDQNYKVTFVYTNGTDTLELTDQDDDPDSTVWTYVETRNQLVEDNLEAETQLFVTDSDGDDITYDILADDGYTFVVTVPDLEHANEGCGGKFNEIYDYCMSRGYQFYFITNPVSQETKDRWARNTGGKYPMCETDERILYEMVRDNPGLMLLSDGKVLRKWSQLGLPDIDFTKPLDPQNIQELPGTRRYAAKPLRFDK